MSGRDEMRRLIREELAKTQVFDIATIDSVRTDGTVNLRWGDTILDGVPANASYTPRTKGDTVLVAKWRGGFRVIDRVGSPATDRSATPETKVTWGNAAPNGSGWLQASSVWVRDHEVFAQLAGGDPPPADVPSPSSIPPSSQGAWRDGFLDSGQSPSQGAWSSYPHPYTGGWFYGSQVTAAGAGKTISGVGITLARSGSRHGSRGDVRPRLYLLSAGSAPSRTPSLGAGPLMAPGLGLGESYSSPYQLPSSWVAALANGSAKGIGCTADVGYDYLIFTGSCGQLTITYS